jgi:hypothetical protein
VAHQPFDRPQLTLPPPLPRRALRQVSRNNRVAAVTARELSRLARKFARLDSRPAPAFSEAWTLTYDDMVGTAEQLQTTLRRASTAYECELLAWSLAISPSKAQLARTPWDRIEGLSPGFVWFQALFEAALFRSSVTSLPCEWLTAYGYGCLDTHCEHQEICETHMRAIWRLNALCHVLIWRALPLNHADRLLVRRAHQVRVLGEKTFNLKYRRAVRAWQRARGEHLPERRIARTRIFETGIMTN